MSGRHHHPCVVCTRTKTDHPVLVFHVFPKDRKRCLQWLSAVNQPILHKKTYEQLNRSCNICSFHFSPKNYINGTPHSRLTKLACPDQNLTDNARDSSSIAANCSYESAFDGSTQGSGNIEKEISVDYTTDVRPRDLQYDFDDLDLASTVEFDVILTRESWDPAFPDPALSGKEVVTRQSELDGNSARTIPPPPPVTPGKSETYRTKSLCPALPAPVVSVDERIAGHSECDTQHSHLKQRKQKKPRKVDDFNCDEAKKKPRKRTRKPKADEKFTGVVFDPRKGTIKIKDISETCDKNSPTENSDRAFVPFKYREKTGKNSELGTRDVIVSKEEDQTEECYSDWITDDEVDDDESDSGKPAFNQGNRTCSHCTLTFNSPLLLLEHLEGNHAAHVCSICGFTTPFKHGLKKHMVKHSKERAFVCDICGKQYSHKQYLKGHISRAHSDYDHGNRYPFNCQHCKRLYHSEANLMRHQKQESGPCEVCGVMLKCSGLLWHHKRDHFSQGENCKKGFQSRNTLLLHKSTTHKKKTIKCPICPKKFAFQSYLNTHLANTHKEGSLQYKCPDCSFCTRSKPYLTSHQSRMHKPPLKFYSCGFCKKDFRSNSRLVEHTRIHTGERPFSCPVCCKTFYTQGNLYAHERSVHNRLTNYGSRDTESRQDAATMRRKISSCYECHLCDSTFPTLKKLKYHLFRDHKIDNDAKKGDNVEQERVVEMNEAGMVPVQMEANAKDLLPEDFEPTVKENDTINAIPPSDEGVVSRVTLPMPAYVVPPNVNFVEIDGVQYHVVRSNQ